MVDPSRHASDRNWFESILRYIPGFRGYLEQEYRRESDFLMRSWLADRLQGSKRGLDDYLRRLVDAVKLDDLPTFERVRSRLDGYIAKLRSAERGYSAMFDFVRIREDELDHVYQVDSGLVEVTEAFVNSVAQLSVSTESPGVLATGLLTQIDNLEQLFAERGNILKGTSHAT